MRQKILIPDRVFFRIGDVAEMLGLKPYVIRFWETEFPFLVPKKSNSGQRVYQRNHVEALALIKHLLYVERYSIEGAKMKLTELRKTSNLKQAMQSVTAGAPIKTENKAEPKPLAVGDTVSKEQIESLKQKIVDLQTFVRHLPTGALDSTAQLLSKNKQK